MGMERITVKLPDTLKGYLEQQAAAAGCAGADAYVRKLIENDQKHHAERKRKLAELRKEINIGVEQLDRGEFGLMSIEEMKAEGHKRLAQKTPKR